MSHKISERMAWVEFIFVHVFDLNCYLLPLFSLFSNFVVRAHVSNQSRDVCCFCIKLCLLLHCIISADTGFVPFSPLEVFFLLLLLFFCFSFLHNREYIVRCETNQALLYELPSIDCRTYAVCMRFFDRIHNAHTTKLLLLSFDITLKMRGK